MNLNYIALHIGHMPILQHFAIFQRTNPPKYHRNMLLNVIVPAICFMTAATIIHKPPAANAAAINPITMHFGLHCDIISPFAIR